MTLFVGDMVEAISEIRQDSENLPPDILANAGDVLFVRAVTNRGLCHYGVAHADRMGMFWVKESEVAKVHEHWVSTTAD